MDPSLLGCGLVQDTIIQAKMIAYMIGSTEKLRLKGNSGFCLLAFLKVEHIIPVGICCWFLDNGLLLHK